MSEIVSGPGNILSGEQEQGTLTLTAATSARLTTVLAGKRAIRAGGVILAAVAGCWALLLAVGTRVDAMLSQQEAQRIAHFALPDDRQAGRRGEDAFHRSEARPNTQPTRAAWSALEVAQMGR